MSKGNFGPSLKEIDDRKREDARYLREKAAEKRYTAGGVYSASRRDELIEQAEKLEAQAAEIERDL